MNYFSVEIRYGFTEMKNMEAVVKLFIFTSFYLEKRVYEKFRNQSHMHNVEWY